MSKVQLRETQKQPDLFDGYIALEDFWPKAASAPDAKPRMLNGDHSLSLLKKHAAQPWSAAAHPYAHRHHSLAQMKTAPQHPSNASLASNASKAKTSNASLASNASKVQVASQKNVTLTAKKQDEPTPTKKEDKPAHAKKEAPVVQTKEEKKAAPAKIESKVTPAKK